MNYALFIILCKHFKIIALTQIVQFSRNTYSENSREDINIKFPLKQDGDFWNIYEVGKMRKKYQYIILLPIICFLIN